MIDSHLISSSREADDIFADFLPPFRIALISL